MSSYDIELPCQAVNTKKQSFCTLLSTIHIIQWNKENSERKYKMLESIINW